MFSVNCCSKTKTPLLQKRNKSNTCLAYGSSLLPLLIQADLGASGRELISAHPGSRSVPARFSLKSPLLQTAEAKPLTAL